MKVVEHFNCKMSSPDLDDEFRKHKSEETLQSTWLCIICPNVVLSLHHVVEIYFRADKNLCMKTLPVFCIFKLLQLSVDLTRKQAGGNRDILRDIWYGGIISHFSDSYPVISNWLSFWVSLFLKTFRFNQPHLGWNPILF